jgi:serine/threonine protein kinase
MGLIMDKVCCIDTNEILDNTNFKNTLNNSSINGEDSINYSQGPSSEIRTLPLSDINTPSKSPKMKINSLSRLPINTKNIIRKVSGNPFDNYKILKKLGHGTFGQVFKIMQKQTGNIRAMKIIPKNNLKPGFTDKDIIHEITIMKNLDHPHIIKLYEFYIDEYNYYLINEYCTEGDLSEKMVKLKSLPEQIVKILMAQIFNAVLYLNNKGIIHGDLKLENILVDSYLEYGANNPKEKNNFISSLMQDAKDIKNYLNSFKLRRSSTTFFGKGSSSDLLNAKEEENDTKGKDDDVKNKNTFQFDLLKLEKEKKPTKIDIFNENDEIESEQKKIEEKSFEEDKCSISLEDRKDNDISGIEEIEEKLISNSFEENSSNVGSDIENSSTSKKKKMAKQVKFQTPLKKKKILNFESTEGKNKNLSLSKSISMTFKEEKKENIECKPVKTITTLQRKSTINYNKLKIKNFELKLIDFGCSKIFTQYRRTFEDTIGTLVYCSPEVLKNNYNQKCDIWSCGVIMYILLCGRYPFYGSSEEEITRKILIGTFNFDDKHFENVSENAKDLIRKCLIHDRNKRISVKEAIKHEFFSGEIDINNIFEDEVDTKNVLYSLKKNSRKISKFYQTVLTYLSYNFADKEELKRLRQIFYKIDLNLDGKISKEELFIAYKDAGIQISKEELEKIIKSIDFDGNGSIEYEEFIRVTLPKDQLFNDINLRNAFEMFDLDKNGSISMSEILEVIGADKEIDKNVIEELKSEILKDGDEEIDFKHFKEIMYELKQEEKIGL